MVMLPAVLSKVDTLGLAIAIGFVCSCNADRPTPRKESVLQSSRNYSEVAPVSMVSASYGGRSRRDVLPRCPPGMSCVMYTDTPVTTVNGWIVDLTPHHTHMQKTHKDLFTSGRHSLTRISDRMVKKNMEAKFYKMNMFVLPQVANADIIFWCDADSITEVCKDKQLVDRIRDSLGGHALTVKAHEERKSVRAEMAPAAGRLAYLGYHKGNRDINDAWAHMEKEGFKDDAGLFHCNQFIFDARSSVVKNLLRAWWYEVQDYTFRDQISFPFVLQQFKPNVRVIPPNGGILSHASSGSFMEKKPKQRGAKLTNKPSPLNRITKAFDLADSDSIEVIS